MFTDFNPELKKKVMQALVEGRSERGLLINRVMLTEMRARKHGQIPQEIEYATGQ
jgi:hypothetical protein